MPVGVRFGAVALALFLALGVTLNAQVYEQLAPKTPADVPVVALPKADARASLSAGGDRVILPVLRGLIFMTDQSQFRREGVTMTSLEVSGEPLLETAEFRALVTPRLGQPVTNHTLDRLTRDVVLYFRQHGRPVVDVLIPEQNVTTGAMQVLVIEGRRGEVRVEGNKWFSAEQIAAAVRAPRDEIIEGAPLLADLVWLNQNPFRQVDLVYTRGERAGETDLVLRVRDRNPLRFYTGYEDSGNALTGFDRVLAGFNWGQALARDAQLNYQFTASPDFRELAAHSASFILPLPRLRHTLTVFGSYAESRPELAGGLFNLDGKSWQVSARYRVPLAARGAWTPDFTAGVDFKRSNNNLSFGGTQVFAQSTDVIQALAALAIRHTDKRGTTTAELTVAVSPGGLSAGNHTGVYRAARAGARPDYAYATFELERITRLSATGWSWRLHGTAQLSSANLLGSEQLGLGGATSLRGYEEREANGDDGAVLVNELHAPVRHLRAGDALDPFVFLDAGVVASHERLTGEPSRLTLASTGLGLRYN
ncbi:MAG: ShlB/FhaC/HecB family hemolysin secretion/activation protein, partial [Opitutaceae bacterium]|nr:ShlB/FhaC/HecB family hemolysin secretion/activation protein [Opitutaceae bacterium]